MKKESVFLSQKTGVLEGVPTGTTQDEIARNLLDLLTRPITVKGESEQGKYEQIITRGVARSVVSYGTLNMEGGQQGYIFSVSYIGTPVCGMYFFREGENFLTEMVDPNRGKVHQTITAVCGERVG